MEVETGNLYMEIYMHSNARQHVTRVFLYAIYKKNGTAHNRAPHPLRASAIEMHVNMSQEPLCVEIYRKKCPKMLPK